MDLFIRTELISMAVWESEERQIWNTQFWLQRRLNSMLKQLKLSAVFRMYACSWVMMSFMHGG